jgi:hypothetical protein
VVLESQFRNRVERFWIDMAQGHSIVRWVSQQPNGKPSYQIEVQYAPDVGLANLWVPRKWTATSFSPSGDALFFESCEVTHIRLNDVLDASTFELDFPVGTRVVDERGNLFRAEADGSLRPVDRPTPRRHSRGVAAMVVIALAASALAAWVVLLRKRRAEGDNSPSPASPD